MSRRELLRVFALPSAVAGITVWRLLTTDSEEFYDADSVHTALRTKAAAVQTPPPLPSAYAPQQPLAHSLRYAFDAGAIAACDCRAAAQRIAFDDETAEWCDRIVTSPLGPAHDIAVRALITLGYSPIDAQALLGEPSCHLLSTAQWRCLLQDLLPAGQPRALDVGAAVGHVTGSLAPLFASMSAVEISPVLVDTLRARGYSAAMTTGGRISRAHLTDAGLWPADGRGFDAVFAINVVDRVEGAADFVRGLLDATAPGGVLVLAMPLPYHARQWTDDAVDDTAWARRHGLAIEGSTWEAAAASAVECLQRETGLPVARLARAPYVCRGWAQTPWGGADQEPLYVLDGALFVIRKP
jgi:SAM-dependent methyltransferase